MNDESYRSIIYAFQEDRNREFKRSFAWERKNHGETMAKVVKTILAMSNLMDGGHIVVGVEQTPDDRFIPSGMLDEHLRTFTYDEIADFVRNYADPYVLFAVERTTIDNKNFVLIAVKGFDEYPVICKDSYADSLESGAIYVRSRSGRPRSERISNYADMRELADLCIERGVRRYLQTQVRLAPPGPSDEEKFNRQLGEFA